MAEDVEFGHVVELTLGEPDGTALVADAAAGATSLSVEYAGDFDEAGALVLNGAMLDYTAITEGVTEGDPDVLTLAVPLAAEAFADDRVGRVAGGEPVQLWQLHVDLGDGDPVDIDIPYEQRAMWSAVDMSTPIPVVLSSDLTTLLEVPGRAPILDQATIDVPFITLYRATGQSIPDSGDYTSIVNWQVQQTQAVDQFTVASGVVTIADAGLYLFTLAVNWAGNSSGRRYIQIVTTINGVDTILRTIPGAPPDALAMTQQIVVAYQAAAGESLRVEVRQTTGAALDVRGQTDGRLTALQIVRLQA